jgi:2-polyprenyl-3-methyl-5-hydroxy-6-metoxy-1,4-benzoquinol methylase
VSECCTPRGYRWVFSERSARGQAKRYRRKGLDATSRRLVDLLKQQSLEGRTLLEVGGGIGAIQIELLKAGLAHAVSIELTPTYEETAAALLREAGLEDRVERRVIDFAEAATEIEAADFVVMNRVVCCYPDMPRLAGAAADHAREVLVLSFPRQSWWTQAALALGNLVLGAARRQFHVFIHPPARILATAEQHGLTTTHNSRGLFWQVAALERVA